MKGTLMCKILGHKFIANQDYYVKGELWVKKIKMEWCVRCGLSKKDLIK
jgi:hypothetical protein